MQVTLIDSPVANVANIARALRHAGAALDVTCDAGAIARAPKIVLPGVGSFPAAMRWLEETHIDAALRDAVVDRGATLLGICVGHQLLFDVSSEMGATRGLGLVRGEIRKFEGALPVPQIGWNAVGYGSGSTPPLFEGIEPQRSFYFVNSYAALECQSGVAFADYCGRFVASVEARAGAGRVFGVQFHPEKSSGAGLQVLRNFVELAR